MTAENATKMGKDLHVQREFVLADTILLINKVHSNGSLVHVGVLAFGKSANKTRFPYRVVSHHDDLLCFCLIDFPMPSLKVSKHLSLVFSLLFFVFECASYFIFVRFYRLISFAYLLSAIFCRAVAVNLRGCLLAYLLYFCIPGGSRSPT